MPEGDTSLGQIVGREFKCYLIARKHANAVAAQAAGEMRKYDAIVLELDAEQTAGEFFKNGPGDLDAVFLAHSTSWSRFLNGPAALKRGRPRLS